jgi:hypothetical protein
MVRPPRFVGNNDIGTLRAVLTVALWVDAVMRHAQLELRRDFGD